MSGSDRNEGIWGVVDDRVVEEVKEHYEIGIWWFYFNSLLKIRRGLLEKDRVSIPIY